MPTDHSLYVSGYAVDGPAPIPANDSWPVGYEEQGLLAAYVELLNCWCISLIITLGSSTCNYLLQRNPGRGSADHGELSLQYMSAVTALPLIPQEQVEVATLSEDSA